MLLLRKTNSPGLWKKLINEFLQYKIISKLCDILQIFFVTYSEMKPSPDPLYVLRSGVGAVTYVTFWTCGAEGIDLKLLSGTHVGKIHIWNLKTRRADFVLEGHAGQRILWLQALSCDSFLSQGRDGQILRWISVENDWKHSCLCTCYPIGFCQCSLLDRFLAKPGKNNDTIEVIDINSEDLVSSFSIDPNLGMPMCMALRRADVSVEDSDVLLFVGFESGTIFVWDVQTGNNVTSFKAHSDSVMCLDVDLSLCGASGSSANKVTKWKFTKDSIKLEHEVQFTNSGATSIAIRPDNKIVAVCTWDSQIRIFAWKKLKPLAVLSYHKENVQSVTFHLTNNQNLLAAGSNDGLITLWSLY